MRLYLPVILVSGMLSFGIMPLVRQLATRLDFVDMPQSRKLHGTPMPMLGGLAIYLSLVVGMTIRAQQQSYLELIGILGGTTIMTVVGLWDDRVGVSPIIKIVAQVVATILLILVGVQVHVVGFEPLNYAITIVWVIGISNAINFQDNMDGLAAGLTVVASAGFFILAVLEGLTNVAILSAATLGATIGFLYYNFSPASLFMGDTGSLALGYILAVLGIKLEFVSQALAATWMIPIVILGVPIFDMTLVVVSRLRRGKSVAQGGKDHTSHRLVSIVGMTHARSVLTLYLIAAALGMLALILRESPIYEARIILVALVIVFIGSLIWLEAKFDESPPAPTEDEAPTL